MSRKIEHPKLTTQNEKRNAPITPGHGGPPPSRFEEMQRDEIEVLRSIFMEDYEDVESKSAWSKATERTLKIKLSSYSDKDVWVYLIVTVTATYPKTVPLLQLGDTSNVRAQTLDSIHSIMAIKPKELLGEVMIHEIASLIQEELEDAAAARVQGEHLPSLEQERAVHEATAFEMARSQEEEVRKRDQQEKEEAERKMQRAIDEQMKKRAEARSNNKPEVSQREPRLESAFETLTFDQPVTTMDEMAHEQTFRSVSLVMLMANGPVTEVHSAAPLLHGKPTQTLVLKRAKLKTCRSKLSVLELEKLLEKLKSFRHPNAINVLGFKIANEAEAWTFDILTDLANQGSLLDMLRVTDVLPVQKARLFSIELLQALDFYHRNGVVHGRIHAGNLILHRLSSGNISLKLADAGFQEALHALCQDGDNSLKVDSKPLSLWSAPELSSSPAAEKSKKADVWCFGVVLVEMTVGLNVTRRFSNPANFMNSTPLSDPFEDLVRDLFKAEARKRPDAFDIVPYEFFRANIPALLTESNLTSRSNSVAGTVANTFPRRLRHGSSTGQAVGPKPTSRYASEWDEAGRLGKGGFGEVVKARNKLDGRIYAIKKITQKTPAELSQVLSEVYLLATLNHPFVVRYYTAWPEDDAPVVDDVSEDPTSSEDLAFLGVGTTPVSADFGHSTGGLDFISSSGYPKIEFGYDDDDEAVSEEEEDSDDVDRPVPVGIHQDSSANNNLALHRTKSMSRPAVKSTLFIQMEFCERLTLRDIIRKGLQDDVEETWRLFRQILEGLGHIHSHGIIHRDLKPENVFIDSANNTKIGDFGLAKSGQFNLADVDITNKSTDGEMTRNVGTTFYVAPELQANSKGTYTDKIDIYSLGIMFFEMCHPLKTAMERGEVLTALRKKEHTLPPNFESPNKAVQGEIIDSLLKHRPSERPSCAELLRSGKVPLQIEDETIKIALEGLADDSSPYYHRMMSALFSKNSGHQIKAQMWDQSTKEVAQTPNVEFVLLQCMVHEKLVACFRRHGAVESHRQGLIPRSDYYQNKNAVQLLDASGTLVQLPYDFTLPHARAVAKQAYAADKTYAIGTVYRDALTGGAPRSSREADFDIVSHDDKDLALKEAEVIKIVDELIDEFPPLSSASMCFHISHVGLLDRIMDFCRVAGSQKSAAKEVLGRLNIQQWTWQKIRLELRSPAVGISSTSLDELAQFDFRETPEKALTRLQSIFAGTDFLPRLHEIFTHVCGLAEYCKRWGVKRKIYFSPLSSFNDRFYQDGIMFQCLFDAKKRDVVAAGGRYDHLVEEHRSGVIGSVPRRSVHAVGVNIAWDRLVTSMARYQKRNESAIAFLKKTEEANSQPPWPTRRCDCLLASFDSTVLRSTGIRLVSLLWANDISAELAVDARTPEELLAHYREDKHSWIITIKHDAASSAKADLKIKSMDKKEDFDVRSSDLLTFIRGEIRDRDQREGASERLRFLRNHPGSDFSSYGPGDAGKAPVHVLTAAHKSKKANKYRVVEAAQAASQELLRSFMDGPIASIETRDEVLEMIRETRLSDAESWRRVVQKVPLSERHYVQEVQELLASFKVTCLEDGGTGGAFVFNFRTGNTKEGNETDLSFVNQRIEVMIWNIETN